MIKLNKGTPPKDGKQYILDLGLPNLTIGAWNKIEEAWAWAILQKYMFHGKHRDLCFDTAFAHDDEVVGWAEMGRAK